MNASASIAAIVRAGRTRGYAESAVLSQESQTLGLVDQLLAALKVYDQVADNFCYKVETGRAISTVTYRALKAARLKSSRIKVSI